MVGASFKSDVFDRANHAWEFMLHTGVARGEKEHKEFRGICTF